MAKPPPQKRKPTLVVSFKIDPLILEAGDLVAESRGVSRKSLFRILPTAHVLAEAIALVADVDPGMVLTRAPEIPDLVAEFRKARKAAA